MNKLFWLMVLLLSTPFIQAQQYIIRYDLAHENVKYFQVKKAGDTAEVPVINLSKSNQVNLQLQNTAGSFRETIDYVKNTETAETIVNPFWGGDINGVSGLSLLKKVSTNLLNKTLPGGEDFVIKALLENDAQKKAKEKFINNYNEFTGAYNNWVKAALFEERCKALWKDLAGLRYNVHLPAEEVKTMTQKKTEVLFPGINENTSTIQLYEMVMNADIQKALAMLKSAQANLKDAGLQYNEMLLAPNPSADSLLAVSQRMLNTANSYPYSKNENNLPGTVNKIAGLYQETLQDNYTRMLPLSVDRHTSAAILKLTPVIDSATRSLLNMKKEDTIKRSIIIYKKAPLRFRNTFGMSFVSYAENRWNYFVKTVNGVNTIERERADIFQPVVMAFLHFYQPRDKGFRWGGSIGTGIPVSGDTRINIMMGISTFLGRNDPVCISAGVSGAQVSKLSGYKTGDLVPFTELDPVKNYNKVYRAGYFVALTFNPGGLNSKD